MHALFLIAAVKTFIHLLFFLIFCRIKSAAVDDADPPTGSGPSSTT